MIFGPDLFERRQSGLIRLTTPTMLMTGDIDLRTPIEETEQFYRALKLRKVDTVMVRIADEFHGIGNRHPSNRVAQIVYLRGWFDKYRTKDKGETAAGSSK